MVLKTIAALLGLLLVTACGGAAPPDDPVNAEDVMYVQMMIAHSHQGIEIVKLAATRATNPELKTMAAAIQNTQQAEVEQMLRWLHEWDQPLSAPSGSHDHHGGLPETDRRQIRALSTSKHFDQDFINLLIAHQDDAVQMAAAEVSGGASPKVKEYAGRVQSSRKAEVGQLMAMLKQ